ncbi:hypothetical protein QFZ99_002914 [Paraburkholderia atlantica]|uniref:hypothetical protein n=1 Tax=Paraburkholderia atlantica TaxID=2654982 RepID=UPI003D1D1C9A
MTNELLRLLPDWRLETAELADFELAAEIEACPAPAALLAALAAALREATVSGQARFCDEAARDDPRGGSRALIRFQVPRALFNWFFSGKAGYRAHFYVSQAYGLAFNDQAVAALVAQLASVMPSQVQGFHIDREGHETPSFIQRRFVEQSLVPALSKLWVGDGVSFTGPHILLPDGRSWSSILCDGNVAGIELKGAFVGPDGLLYQPKDPHRRAERLHEQGAQ